MDKKKCFITTTDENVKEVFIKAGYPLVSSDSGRWTFVNIKDGKDLSFAKDGKFSFTNKLNI